VWIGTSLKRVIFVTTSGGKQVLRCVGRPIHPSARRGVPTKFALPEFVILEDEGVVDPGHPYLVPSDRYPHQGLHHPCVELAARLAH
jgi:hypothetical protein